MELSLKHKVAIVTGASVGIGKAIAAEYARAGAQVIVVSRRAEACAEAAADIGLGCKSYAANVGDREAAEAVVDAVVAEFGRIDILVNNAATNHDTGLVIDADMGSWNKTLLVNLTAPLFWSQFVWAKSMRDSAGGCAIVNISSVGGLWTSRNHGVYDVSKAALIHLTMQLAAELGPKVRVNSIAPGLTKTRFSQRLFVDEQSEERLAREYPLRRLGNPEDIANAAVFLASEASGWITGQTLAIDGGGQIGFSRTG